MAVTFEVHGGVAVITINRPQVRNAINREVALAVEAAVVRVNAEPDIRCAVITGAGSNFSAGMDLKAFLRGEVVRLPGTGLAGFTQAKLLKPFIAAVEGYALAGGFEIMLACDMVVAAQDAKLGLTEVKRGLVANGGGLVRLPRQMPIKLASEFVLTGEIYPAERLASAGLINRIVPSGEVLAAALDLAHTVADNGPMAVAASRQVGKSASRQVGKSCTKVSNGPKRKCSSASSL
jgi:enoyl-CoA hydratase